MLLVVFDPILGSEQNGKRPALVISERAMHEMTRRVIVCPITRNVRPWPTKVMLPPAMPAQGAVLTDQVRAIDRKERILRRLGAVPDAVLHDVRRMVAALLGIEMRDVRDD